MSSDIRIPVVFDELSPDVLVAPESKRCPDLGGAASVRHQWAGSIDNRGLGVYSRFEMRSASKVDEVQHRWSLAARVAADEHDVTILGVWTLPSPAGSFRSRYLNALAGILAQHDELLLRGAAIVAGDFNVAGDVHKNEFATYLGEIRDRYGLVSAYHEWFCEPPGQETRSTYWHQGHEDRSFHIDYLLVPEAWEIRGVDVGTFQDWGTEDGLARSDHAPVSVDISP